MTGELVVGFDLDMTLVDSHQSIADTLRVTLAERGVAIDNADAWPYVGIPMDQTIAAVAPQIDPEEIPKISARYRELYPTVGVPSVTQLAGAEAALQATRPWGGRSLVVSAKHTPNVRRVLAAAGLLQAVGPDDVIGDLFAEQKGHHLSQQGAAVYVGDHPGDVVAARTANAVSVAVATGAYSSVQLRDAGADVVLLSLLEFPEWLQEFARQAGVARPA